MTCHNIQDLLNDYLDGLLGAEEIDAVDQHVRSCASCGEALRQLDTLILRARSLSKKIDPSRDLWPEISAKLEKKGRPALSVIRTDSRPRWIRRPVLAAAAVLLALVSVLMALSYLKDRPYGPVLSENQRWAGVMPVASMPDDFKSAEEAYRQVSLRLREVLDERKDTMTPETLAVVYENVRIIDGAVQKIREALARDPGSPALNLLLLETYQREVELLRRATKLPAQI